MIPNGRQDEYLEALWCMQEQGADSAVDLETALSAAIDGDDLDGIVSAGLVTRNTEDGRLALTQEGFEHARGLVRKHRIAERLLHDVLGFRSQRFESEACTFEHLTAPHVVDSICTLLGHPRECPHGLPIPEGPCCLRSENVIQTAVTHLSELDVGQSGQVAYVNCDDDGQLHRLNGLQIKPGAEIKIHQKYPAWVVECEGGMIAIDARIADSICLWKKPRGSAAAEKAGQQTSRGGKWRFWRRERP